MHAIAQKLDAHGMNCPLPILRTRKAINQISSGELLEVTATDPGSLKDMEVFCQQTGNRLVSSSEADNSFIFLIEKA
ncbi:MAG: sulfurtransferase TusA family protein [Gammaproteobacteria bacterium]